jgi:hypothetical protein
VIDPRPANHRRALGGDSAITEEVRHHSLSEHLEVSASEMRFETLFTIKTLEQGEVGTVLILFHCITMTVAYDSAKTERQTSRLRCHARFGIPGDGRLELRRE